MILQFVAAIARARTARADTNGAPPVAFWRWMRLSPFMRQKKRQQRPGYDWDTFLRDGSLRWTDAQETGSTPRRTSAVKH
jgi:hypothetical protein